MLPKLFLIIVVAGATAAALLVNRQHRIDTAHEIFTIHHRMLSQERALWRIRVEIGQRVQPDEVREQMKRHGGTWASIPERPNFRPIEQLRLAHKNDEHDPDRDEEQVGG